MRTKKLRIIFTFASTADAMAAEKAFRRRGVPGRTIPVPRSISASCGISWASEPGDRARAEDALRQEGLAPEGIFECMIFV